MVCISNESFEEEVLLIQKLEKLHVDGVLICTSSETNNFDHLKKMQNKGIPVVVFDRDCSGLKADKVLVDCYSGSFEAVESLIQSGCKKIAHLAGPQNSSTTKQRLNGYLDALKKNKIPIIKEYIHHVSEFTFKSGIKASEVLLKLKNSPDAIFAVNDNIAIAAINVAKKMSIKIPEELSIVGFNDDPHSSFMTPSLSTVLQPIFSIGMLSARILLHHLKGVNTKIEFRHEVFKTELIIRESSKFL
jgi:DNA-binding LacI/PurR family transcriptional regulator